MYSEDSLNPIVNLEAIIKSNDIHPVVRRIATIIKNGGGYASVGDVFGKIGSDEIYQLLEMCETEAGEQGVVLSTLILTQGESVFPKNLEELSRYTGAFRIMVGCMVLVHQGEMRVNLENMTFGEDMGDRVVFY